VSVGIQRLRDDAETVRKGATDKGYDASEVDAALELDTSHRRMLGEVERLRAERNQVSEQVGALIRGGADPTGAEVGALRQRSTEIAQRLAEFEPMTGELAGLLEQMLLRIPNPADPDVPAGPPDATVTVRSWGEPLAHDAGGWERKPHWEIGERLGMIDLPAGAKVTGTGFPIYRGAGARLERALINLMLELQSTQNGMTEIWPPAVVNQDSARGTGQIPDKEDQMYVVTRDELYLVPTAEVSVTNIHRDEIIDAERLPIRYVAYSPSFRREAGAAGKQTRGILRVHQFDKVEMVSFTKPDDSAGELERMTGCAEAALQLLGLAYRVRLLSTGDMGFTQAKTYDLEAWSPGVQEWLEVSSVSNFRDFQARRMNIRYRPEPGAKPEILHTLNGSSLGFARTFAALLETYQQQDGSLALPEPIASRVGEIS